MELVYQHKLSEYQVAKLAKFNFKEDIFKAMYEVGVKKNTLKYKKMSKNLLFSLNIDSDEKLCAIINVLESFIGI